jgi:holo-[acyl-carrier protein] synthase
VRIYRDTLGRPAVTLHGAAEQRLQALGGSQVLLSLSDERDYVVAFAVVS